MTAQGDDQRSGDVEPESEPLLLSPRLLGAEAPLEEMRDVLGRDARALIDHWKD